MTNIKNSNLQSSHTNAASMLQFYLFSYTNKKSTLHLNQKIGTSTSKRIISQTSELLTEVVLEGLYGTSHTEQQKSASFLDGHLQKY